jgi:signal transduction histidine kinase
MAWRPVSERSILTTGVGLLLVLLALLATLQYRWTGEVGEAEKARLSANARNRAERVARDFDREVTRAFLWLQVDSESVKTHDFSRYLSRHATWAERAEHPKLVRDVLLVEPNPVAGVSVRRFEPGAGRFEATSWPSDLDPVRRRIEAVFQGRPEGPRGLIVDDVPALIAPLPSLTPPPVEGAQGSFEPFRVAGVTVIVLDSDFIRQQLLPSLATRHFGAEGGLDYNLTVFHRNEPSRIVYASDKASPSRAEDVSTGLLELRFEEMSPEDLAWMPPSRRPGPAGERFGGRGPEAGRWRLAATHRVGSLEEIVAAARRRNLALSFGILLLLGASMALIVAATLRARRLAERQMEFVAGVSHELRTPVAVICAAGENLADGIVASPDQVRRYGATVRDEGRRLAEMVERVLEFAGTYSGRRVYRFQPVSVSELFKVTRHATAVRAEEMGLRIQEEVVPGLLDVEGDMAALRHVLLNLVENAMKYAADGRWLGLKAAPDVLRGLPAVRISVEDRGGGIPAAELSQIFEPFYRARAAHEGQERGFGLGLSLVKRVVEAHHGRVAAESEPGRGTTFSITLPAVPKASEAVGLGEGADGIAHSAR